MIATLFTLRKRVLAGLLSATLVAAPAYGADTFTFAALGDMPYSEDEEAEFIGLIAELNRSRLAFVVHVGDFKNGHSECSDAVFLERRKWFALSHHPWIYTPGDNEWTDCRRGWGRKYAPRERLERLREIFFSRDTSLGDPSLQLVRQSDGRTGRPLPYPENARWIYGGVVFATLNVPGGGNNLVHDRAEFQARDAAVRAWTRSAFDVARARHLPAVVLMMQADPWAAAGVRRRGYEPLLATLRQETLTFPGQVLLIHGDTHRYRVDHPLLSADKRGRIANFTRVEVYGHPTMNWVRIRVERADGKVGFEVSPGS
jgi:hypothetical protein